MYIYTLLVSLLSFVPKAINNVTFFFIYFEGHNHFAKAQPREFIISE